MAIGKGLAKKNILLKIVRSIFVSLFLFYLRFWAKITINLSKATIIGIAGAVGKSTTRNALATILQNHKQTAVIEGNSETGIPLGILGFDHHSYHLLFYLHVLFQAPLRIRRLRYTDFIVIEMGIDGPTEPKNMSYLLKIARPDCAILLSESLAHSEQYQSIIPKELLHKDIAEQEQFLVEYQMKDDGRVLTQPSLSAAIVDATDSNVYEYSKKIVSKGKLYTAGREDHHDVTIHYYEVSTKGTRFDFLIHTHQQKDFFSLFFPDVAIPEQTGGSLGTAIVAAIHLGVPIVEIQQALSSKMTFPPGRGSLLLGKKQTILYDSSYNASPQSVLATLAVVKAVKKQEKKTTICVLGDMKELGIFSPSGHLSVAKALPDTADHVLLVGPLTKQFILPYLAKHNKKFASILWFEDIHQLADHLLANLPENALICFKGSQNLEEVIKPLLFDTTDITKLCRQEPFWEESKKKNGVWIEAL